MVNILHVIYGHSRLHARIRGTKKPVLFELSRYEGHAAEHSTEQPDLSTKPPKLIAAIRKYYYRTLL